MTNKQMLKWHKTVDWNATYTCDLCGKQDSGYYVQPQPPDIPHNALCADCITKLNQEYKQKRKEQLSKLPRCQVPGCKIRGTLKVGSYNPVLMCRKHYNKANQAMQAEIGGLFWLSFEMTGEDALRFAQTTQK